MKYQEFVAGRRLTLEYCEDPEVKLGRKDMVLVEITPDGITTQLRNGKQRRYTVGDELTIRAGRQVDKHEVLPELHFRDDWNAVHIRLGLLNEKGKPETLQLLIDPAETLAHNLAIAQHMAYILGFRRFNLDYNDQSIYVASFSPSGKVSCSGNTDLEGDLATEASLLSKPILPSIEELELDWNIEQNDQRQLIMSREAAQGKQAGLWILAALFAVLAVVILVIFAADSGNVSGIGVAKIGLLILVAGFGIAMLLNQNKAATSPGYLQLDKLSGEIKLEQMGQTQELPAGLIAGLTPYYHGVGQTGNMTYTMGVNAHVVTGIENDQAVTTEIHFLLPLWKKAKPMNESLLRNTATMTTLINSYIAEAYDRALPDEALDLDETELTSDVAT